MADFSDQNSCLKSIMWEIVLYPLNECFQKGYSVSKIQVVPGKTISCNINKHKVAYQLFKYFLNWWDIYEDGNVKPLHMVGKRKNLRITFTVCTHPPTVMT